MIYSPRLTEARVAAPPTDGVSLIWRINSSLHPVALEISRDNGRTWKRVDIANFQPKSVAWKEPMVWTVDSQGAVMQSDDNGRHWTRLHHTLPGSPAR